MRAFTAVAALVAVLSMTTAVQVANAQVGTSPSGSGFVAGTDSYLMCGKCNWASSSGANLLVGSYWKLVCTGDKTANNTFAWINWDCDAGCATCKQRVDITTGQMIKAQYNEFPYLESTITNIRFGQVAASFQCCPKVAETTTHADSTCTSTDMKTTFQPSGCSGTVPGRTSWSGSYCATQGAPPPNLYFTCTSATALYPNDACPTDSSTCTAVMSLANDPCMTVNGVAGLFGTRTVRCLIDETQICLRAVNSVYYNSNMSSSGSLETLSCTSGGASLTSVAAMASALLVAMVAVFFFSA